MIRTELRVLIMLVPSMVFGQDTVAKPAFDVSSVKPSVPGSSGGGITPGPTGLTARNVTLLFCLRIAYDVQDYQVSGPNWVWSAKKQLRFENQHDTGNRQPMLG